jgi:hypothetical protein
MPDRKFAIRIRDNLMQPGRLHMLWKRRRLCWSYCPKTAAEFEKNVKNGIAQKGSTDTLSKLCVMPYLQASGAKPAILKI